MFCRSIAFDPLAMTMPVAKVVSQALHLMYNMSGWGMPAA